MHPYATASFAAVNSASDNSCDESYMCLMITDDTHTRKAVWRSQNERGHAGEIGRNVHGIVLATEEHKRTEGEGLQNSNAIWGRNMGYNKATIKAD